MFRPDPFRYYACYLCLVASFGLCLTVSMILLMGLLSPSPIKIETFVLGAVVSLITIAIVPLFNLAGQLIGMSITLSEKYIAGPSLWVNQPVRFSLKDLDKEKSSRQSFFQRLFGYRLIVSTSGQKILFVERAFDKKPAADILKTIGDADKIAA